MSATILIKIGTNVITEKNGLLNKKIIQNIVEQVAEIKAQGINIVIVSSGAMGAGRSLITLDEKKDNIVKRQVLASVGQVKLMATYAELFEQHKLLCAQVLATKEDFRDRRHYLNMSNCFQALVQNNIIPIVNENDVISIDELMFTDNDELATLIAAMLNVDKLILLSSVNGILDQNTQPIATISQSNFTEISAHIRPSEKSTFGRGGMLTKCHHARTLAAIGITTHIADGRAPDIIKKIMAGENIGTTFTPDRKLSSVKRWLTHSQGQEKGSVIINKCAEDILRSPEKVASLLPIGITEISGDFEKGDIITIRNEQNEEIGLGTAQYSAASARNYLGQKNKKALIHYDHLVIKNP